MACSCLTLAASAMLFVLLPGACNTGDTNSGAGTPDAAPSGDLRSCTAAADCTLTPLGCCAGDWIPENFTAVRRDRASAFWGTLCPDPHAATCDSSLPVQGGLLPACVDGECVVAVVASDPISGCSSTQDCVALNGYCGASQSQCFSFLGAVAIRSDSVSEYQALICSEGLQAYPCEATDAGSATAVCGSNGHCQVVFN